MFGKKLILESGQQYAVSSEAHPQKESHYVLASFVEVRRENEYQKTQWSSEGREKPGHLENEEDAQTAGFSSQVQIINQVCAVLLKTVALFFTAAIAIAIFQALFL